MLCPEWASFRACFSGSSLRQILLEFRRGSSEYSTDISTTKLNWSRNIVLPCRFYNSFLEDQASLSYIITKSLCDNEKWNHCGCSDNLSFFLIGTSLLFLWRKVLSGLEFRMREMHWFFLQEEFFTSFHVATFLSYDRIEPACSFSGL